MSRPNMVQEFAQVGLGQWFRVDSGVRRTFLSHFAGRGKAAE
jgi:hypothetical protein